MDQVVLAFFLPHFFFLSKDLCGVLKRWTQYWISCSDGGVEKKANQLVVNL
jgi:hypothetical protein